MLILQDTYEWLFFSVSAVSSFLFSVCFLWKLGFLVMISLCIFKKKTFSPLVRVYYLVYLKSNICIILLQLFQLVLEEGIVTCVGDILHSPYYCANSLVHVFTSRNEENLIQLSLSTFTQPKNPLRHLHMLLFFFVEFIRQISCLATFKTLTHHEPVIRILSSLIHWFSSHQLLGCLYLCLWLEKSGHMYCYTWLFFCLRSIPRTFSCILLGANFVQFFHSFSMNNSIN